MDKHGTQISQVQSCPQIPTDLRRTKQFCKNCKISLLNHEQEYSEDGEVTYPESPSSSRASFSPPPTAGSSCPDISRHSSRASQSLPRTVSSPSPSSASHIHPPVPYFLPMFIPVFVPAYPPPFPSIFPPYIPYGPSHYNQFPYPFPYPFPSHSTPAPHVQNPHYNQFPYPFPLPFPSHSTHSPRVQNPNQLPSSDVFNETSLEFAKLGQEIANQLQGHQSSAAATNTQYFEPTYFDMEAVLKQNIELLQGIKETLQNSIQPGEHND